MIKSTCKYLFLFFVFLTIYSCGVEQKEVEFSFYVNKTVNKSIPDKIIELCNPYANNNCGIDYIIGNSSKIIKIQSQNLYHVLEITGQRTAKQTKRRIKSILSQIELDDAFIKNDEFSLSDVTSLIRDKQLETSSVFFFNKKSNKGPVLLDEFRFQSFNDLKVLRDSISERICKYELEQVVIFYNLPTGDNLSNNCFEKCKDVKRSPVCGDGKEFPNRCLAECNGAVDITSLPCVNASVYEVPELDDELLKSEADGFINNFFDYLNDISEGTDYRKDALALFINNGEEVTVEMNNAGSDEIFKVSLESYLDDVYRRADRLEFKIGNVSFGEFATKTEAGTDFPRTIVKGKFDQEYKRYDRSLGTVKYSDKTKKGIEVIARLEKAKDGEELVYRAYLSNIKVNQKAVAN